MKKLTLIMIGLVLSLQLHAAPGDKGKGKGAENSAAGLTAEEKADRKADRDERKADRKERKADEKAERKVKTRRPRNWTGKGRTNRAEPTDPTEALGALERHSESLLDESNIIGTGVSWDRDGTPVIKVFTSRRGNGRNIPAALDGVRVVSAHVGAFYALNLDCDTRNGAGCEGADAAVEQQGTGESEAVAPNDWHERPVPIGVSIGLADASAGTLGCRVSQGCHNYALSNAHVSGPADASLLQPSSLDGGMNPDDEIARMYAAVPIVLGTGAEVENRVDAALFQVSGDSVGTTTRENGYGEPKVETVDAALNVGVMKYGRSSALTNGFIDTIAATVIVTYEEGEARFVDQMIVQSDTQGVDFSLPGDSGSLVVVAGGEDDRKPVGLLFASGKGFTVANPITEVLNALDADIDGEF